MSTDSTRLHHDFEALADTITSPGPLDLDRAVAAGHRRAVRRRAVRTGSASMGVAATVALALTAVHLIQAPAAPNGAAGPSPATAPMSVPRTATDPFANGDSFGWLPDGMRATGYVFDATQHPTPSGVDDIVAATGRPNSPMLTLGVFSGPRPDLPLYTYPVKPPVYTAGPLVNGRKSYIESYSGSNAKIGATAFYYLMWQFDDGTWAILGVTSLSPGSALSADDILHIARTVTEKPDPIPQYFQIAKPLADAEVVQAHTTGPSSALIMRAGTAEIDITVQTKKIAGQECKGGNARFACVVVHGRLPQALAAGGIPGILGDITLVQVSTTDVIKRS